MPILLKYILLHFILHAMHMAITLRVSVYSYY